MTVSIFSGYSLCDLAKRLTVPFTALSIKETGIMTAGTPQQNRHHEWHMALHKQSIAAGQESCFRITPSTV